MTINEGKPTITYANMEEQEIMLLATWLPFQIRDLDEGIKYLGFHLKPNDYRKVDWLWLLEKLEKRMKVWSHKWLSRVAGWC